MPSDYDSDPENTSAASPADHAFLAGEQRTFMGSPLKPFSVRRQMAAQYLGNKLLSGHARLENVPCQCAGDPDCVVCKGAGEIPGAYDGMFLDMAATVYLCQCRESDVMMATRQPEKVLENVFLWAEEINMAVGSSVFLEASVIYGEIMTELYQSQFRVVEKPAEGTPRPKA